MEGEAVSDDDFQNESVFTRRTTAAEKQQVQHGKAKVCKGDRWLYSETVIWIWILSFMCHVRITACNEWHLCRQKWCVKSLAAAVCLFQNTIYETFPISLTFAQKFQACKYLSFVRTPSLSVNLDIFHRSFLSMPNVDQGVSSWMKKRRCQKKTMGAMCHPMKRMETSRIILLMDLLSTTHTVRRDWTVQHNFPRFYATPVNYFECNWLDSKCFELNKLCCNIYTSCLFSVRVRDARYLPEVSEKPCSPGQV